MRSGGLFLGFCLHNKPVNAPLGASFAANMLISGPTGAGKGIAIQNLVASALKTADYSQNRSVILFNPKRCEDLRSCTLHYSKKFGRPVYQIDLKGTLPQLNLFRGLKQTQILEILESLIDLELRGQESDIYKVKEKAVLIEFARFAELHSSYQNISELFHSFSLSQHELVKQAPKLFGQLRNMAIPCFCAKVGFNLAVAVEQGALIIIEGSVTNKTIISAQKLLLAWINSYLEARDWENSRRMLIVLDEYGTFAGVQSIKMSRVIRAYGAAMIYVTQNGASDLRQVDDVNFDPDVAEQTLLSNTPLKFQYRCNTYESAEFYSKLSGTVRGHEESISTELSFFGYERPTGEISLKEVELPFVSINELMNLEDGAGYLFDGKNLAQKVYVPPLSYEEQVKCEPTDFGEVLNGNHQVDSAAEDLIDVDA